MILCCGEALIDMVPRVDTEGEACFRPISGGAVFNTAIALGRLGIDTGYFGGISNDLFGQQLLDSCESSRVSTLYCSPTSKPTTLAFVELTNGHAKYTFNDEGTAGRMLAPSDLPQLGTEVEALFFGGISLVVEPCAQAYEELLRREHENKVVMIDPNIRPGFVTDENVFRERLSRMIALADIVKLSDEDLQWLLGEGDIETLAKQLILSGPKLVFITQGSKGATCYTANHTVFAAAPNVDVVDTIGAGDTFNAGVLRALSTQGLLSKQAICSIAADQIEVALESGVNVSAVTVSRAGANPPWAHEL
ncbi:carbohydrate kinase [Falsihalocynthiibacter sp. SS001]|uniref:carbohydrate kinase family protein n=1 Tax=Falsihalocynthiibacter sp. SS001 TaxID=3349698 RepID=UPI0036D2D3A3